MSFRTFVPAEFHHGVRAMSYDDQLKYLYVIVVAPVCLKYQSQGYMANLQERVSRSIGTTKDSIVRENLKGYINAIKRMRAAHDEDSTNAYATETIQKFFEDRGSSWSGYTDEYAWGEILKEAENEEFIQNMIAEIIVRLNMYWDDVQYVQSTIDAFYNKATKQMKERIAKKKDEIEKFNINFNAKQKIRRARFKMSFLTKSPELKFITQFRRIATGEEVPKGIDKEAVEKVWYKRKNIYKSIFDGNNVDKQVEKLIIMYNSTRKKIKGRLVLYGILKDDSTWKGEIRRSTEDADNLAYFRKMTENSEIERKRRVEQVKKQRARDLAEWKRKTEEAKLKMYNR